MENNCDIWKRYHKQKLHRAVGFSMACDFNDVVSMDLNSIGKHQFSHLIDNSTRDSAAAIVKSKNKEVIVEKIFTHWIAVFGCPKRF